MNPKLQMIRSIAFAEYARTSAERLYDVAGEFARPFALLCAFPIAAKTLELSFPILVGRAAEGIDEGQGAGLTLCIVGVAIVTMLVSILGTVQWNSFSRRVGRPLQKKVTVQGQRKLQELSFGQVAGDFSRYQGTIEKAERAFVKGATALYAQVVPVAYGVVVCVIISFAIHPLIGAVALVAFASFQTASMGIDISFLSRIRRLSKGEARLSRTYLEKLQNTVETVLGCRQEAEVRDYALMHQKVSRHNELLWGKYTWMTTLARQPIAALCFLCLVAISASLAVDGEITIVGFVAVMWWSASVFSSLSSLTQVQRDLMEGWSDIERFLDFLAEKPRFELPENPLHPSRFMGIRVDELSYSDSRPPFPIQGIKILECMSFTIRRGEFVAIVGPSGAGKTTVLSAILGSLYADPGKVWVLGDDMCVEMRQMSREWLWKRIGYVPQHPRLWNKSMADNILYGRDGVSEEKLVWAMKAARLYDDFYLPDSTGRRRMYDLVGENGSKLSGGERQRVAIAHALVGDPSILLFDEAMSGLDNENEAKVLETILDLARERDESGAKRYTIIVIAHKIVTAAQADRILLIHKGRVVGNAPHLELLEASPLYRNLAFLETKASRLNVEEAPEAEIEAVV